MASDSNRRKFLGTAAGVAAFTIVPRHVLGGPGMVAPSDKITLAHIGTGTEGLREMLPLLAAPEIQIVAVCDPNKHRRRISRLVRQRHPQLPSAARSASPTGAPAARASFPAAAMCGQEHRRYLLRQSTRVGQFQRLRRLRRFSRAVREGEGPGRRQDHDAGPSARRHQHGGHEARQTRHHAQAHRQSPEGSAHGRSTPRAPKRRRHALHAVGFQRVHGAGDGVDQATAPSAPCAKSTTGPTARFGRSTPPFPPTRRRCPRVSIGTCGSAPKPRGPIIPTTPTWCSAAGTISAAAPWPTWATTACGPCSTRWNSPAPPASSRCSVTIAC